MVFQINLPVYEMALHEIKSWVDTKNVLDLYAGVGTIGLSVAQNCGPYPQSNAINRPTLKWKQIAEVKVTQSHFG